MWKLNPLKHSTYAVKLETIIDGKPLDLQSDEAQLLLPTLEDYNLDNLLASNVPLNMCTPHIVPIEDSVKAEDYLEKNFDSLTNNTQSNEN